MSNRDSSLSSNRVLRDFASFGLMLIDVMGVRKDPENLSFINKKKKKHKEYNGEKNNSNNLPYLLNAIKINIIRKVRIELGVFSDSLLIKEETNTSKSALNNLILRKQFKAKKCNENKAKG